MYNKTRRIICIIAISILLAVIFSSCSSEAEESNILRAKVTEISSGSMLVEPVEGSPELNSSDVFSVGLQDMSPSPEPQVGDIVEIAYSGEIAEIYPAVLGGVTRIEVVEKAENAASDSDNMDVPVSMDIYDVLPTGAVLRFRQTGKNNDDEFVFGESFALQRKNGDKWEDMPTKCDAIFNAIGYIFPPDSEETELETDWEWLYGALDPGTYRISKTLMDSKDNEYQLYAEFTIE